MPTNLLGGRGDCARNQRGLKLSDLFCSRPAYGWSTGYWRLAFQILMNLLQIAITNEASVSEALDSIMDALVVGGYRSVQSLDRLRWRTS